MLFASVLITCANGPAGIHAAERLLRKYPFYEGIFLVRDASEGDANTNALRELIAKYPASKATIYAVNMAVTGEVHAFVSDLQKSITNHQHAPIKAIIWNASFQDLVGDSGFVREELDMTIHIVHIGHVALIMRLLGNFHPSGGRILLISDILKYRRDSRLSMFMPELPHNLDNLAVPVPQDQVQGTDFQRYATAMLLATTWLDTLNVHLLGITQGTRITAVYMDPGRVCSTRTSKKEIPKTDKTLAHKALAPMKNFFKTLAKQAFRTGGDLKVEIMDVAADTIFMGQRGCLSFLDRDQVEMLRLDARMQRKVWRISAQWAGISPRNTILTEAL